MRREKIFLLFGILVASLSIGGRCCALAAQVVVSLAGSSGSTEKRFLLESPTDIQPLVDRLGVEEPGSALTIHFNQGVHRQQSPIKLSARHHFRSITIEGDGSEKSILTGTREISTEGTTSYVKLALPRLDTFEFLSAEIGFQKPIRPRPIQVFANEERLSPTRWPAAGDAAISVVEDEQSTTILRFDESIGASWPNQLNGRKVRLSGYFFHSYAFESVPAVIVGDHALSVKRNTAKYGFKVGGRAHIENWLSDGSVGWNIDDSTSELTVRYPAASKLSLPIVEGFIRGSDTSNVIIRDLSIFGYTGDAISMSGGRNWRISNVIIHGIGNRAVVFEGTDSSVSDCRIFDIGEGGVVLRGGTALLWCAATFRL